MSASAHRKRANSSLTFETLDVRQLLSANMPAFPAAEVRAVTGAGPLDKAPSLFIEPQAGRAPIIGAIDAARSQIRLGICNLSDPQIGDALAAAVARGVNVRVIADHADYMNKPEERAELATLSEEGVSVHLSNSVFPQSFEKELVIDQRQVLIMTMCLIPTTFVDSRDFGLVLNNPGIIRGVTSVFDTDWAARPVRSQPDLGPDRRNRQALTVDPVGPPNNQYHERAAWRSLPRRPVDRGSPSWSAGAPDHTAEPNRGGDQCA
jgi:phosphatidylserine/phosphatidylglycerophosphate/cardiolipin synthase-like enzyme